MTGEVGTDGFPAEWSNNWMVGPEDRVVLRPVADDIDAPRQRKAVVFRAIEFQYEYTPIRYVLIKACHVRGVGRIEIRPPLRSRNHDELIAGKIGSSHQRGGLHFEVE